MAELEFSKDFENLGEKLKEVERKAPGRIYNKLDEKGNKIKNELKKVTPRGTQKKPSSKRLRSGWTYEKTVKIGNSYELKIRNKRPHFHLVERGHVAIVHGKKIGRIDGREFTKKKLDELEPEIDNMFEDVLDDIMGEW